MPTSKNSSCNDLRLSMSIAAMTKLQAQGLYLKKNTVRNLATKIEPV